jgi:predicted transcriptional regulator
VTRGLGELDVLWRTSETMRVRDVLEALTRERAPAYTTVMTVLDNLHRKGWVVRHMVGRAYRYEPTTTKDEAAARALRELLDSAGDPEAVLMHFAKSVSARESEVLRKAPAALGAAGRVAFRTAGGHGAGVLRAAADVSRPVGGRYRGTTADRRPQLEQRRSP